MTGTARLLEDSYRRHGAKGPNERGDYQLNCPFCEDREGKVDEKFKLSANPRVAHPDNPALKGGWVCWRCDARGWGNLEFLDDWKIPEATQEEKLDLGPPFGFTSFYNQETSLALEPYRKYLRKRGVYDYVEAIGGGACLTGRFEGRVIVPYIQRGKWVGFSARAVGDQQPKYLYPRGMDRRHALWGLEWVPDDGEPIYVVEGVFDALPLFPYGIATFGKSVTPEQMDMIAGLDRPVVVCLDGDAWEECQALAARIVFRRIPTNGPARVNWCRLPPGSDPGTLGWGVKQYLQLNG